MSFTGHRGAAAPGSAGSNKAASLVNGSYKKVTGAVKSSWTTVADLVTGGLQQLLSPPPPSYEDACWDTPAPSSTRLPSTLYRPNNTSHSSRGRSAGSLGRLSHRRGSNTVLVNPGHNPRDPVVLPQRFKGYTYLPPSADEVMVNVVRGGSLTSSKPVTRSSSSKGQKLLKSVSNKLLKSLSLNKRGTTSNTTNSTTSTGPTITSNNSSNRRRTAPEILPNQPLLSVQQQQQQLSRRRSWHGLEAGASSSRRQQLTGGSSRAREAWRAALSAVTVSKKASKEAVVL